MVIPIELIMGVIIGIIIGTLSYLYLRYYMLSKDLEKEIDNMKGLKSAFSSDDVLDYSKKDSCREIISKKMEKKFRDSRLKMFYFLNTSAIEDLFCQLNLGPEPINLETEVVQERGGEVGANIGPLSPKYKATKTTGEKRAYEFSNSLAEKYNKIEKSLIENSDVTFALECFAIDSRPIDEFLSIFNKIKPKIEKETAKEIQDKCINDEKRDQAVEWSEYVTNASGFVAMQSEFVFDPEEKMLELDHPLNSYLYENDRKISIKIILGENDLNPSLRNIISQGNSINVSCLGRITHGAKVDGILIVEPISIY